MLLIKKVSGGRVDVDLVFFMFNFLDAFFSCATCYCRKNELDACIFYLTKSNFACCYERLKKKHHKKVELMYCLEELLDSLFTFPKERGLCNFQKFLNERYFPLEEKEQLADKEYISLDLALTYIFALKKKKNVLIFLLYIFKNIIIKYTR